MPIVSFAGLTWSEPRLDHFQTALCSSDVALTFPVCFIAYLVAYFRRLPLPSFLLSLVSCGLTHGHTQRRSVIAHANTQQRSPIIHSLYLPLARVSLSLHLEVAQDAASMPLGQPRVADPKVRFLCEGTGRDGPEGKRQMR